MFLWCFLDPVLQQYIYIYWLFPDIIMGSPVRILLKSMSDRNCPERVTFALIMIVNSHAQCLQHETICDRLKIPITSRPRWLSWMRRPTGNQEVAGSTLAEVGNILSWRLIMKYFLRSFSLPLIQEGQLSVSGERMCTILVNRLED